MAASILRMNGQWRRLSGVLILCVLLLSNEVMCEDTATVGNAADAANPTADASADVPDSSGVTPTVASGGDPATSGKITPDFTLVTIIFGNGGASATSGITIAPAVRGSEVEAVPGDDKKPVIEVRCVEKKEIKESNAVKATVKTNDCEDTKRIIEENPEDWCKAKTCNLNIFQNGTDVLIASEDVKLNTLADTLMSGKLKDKLGVQKAESPSSSSNSSVFVGILVSGLLAALSIIIGYFKCQRKANTKGVRLAEEASPVNQENQGNTLVSVAPLNPPAETQEKPSINGESPEAAKTQPPPPTNGHSTAKTADTEL
ncbi:uncharacterized protein cd34 [Mastacembelus armatus]|uniref:Uncharacterized LOC113145283 n=1 Tax=Mastacembelus armatus TaxID=205130 RepID=A0A3Q3KTW7_9TELE|nr:uncharacterized protein LOC113145283 [Mastacembelus armatus]